MKAARRIAVMGVVIGAIGLGVALWRGPRLSVAFCGVVWGMTVSLAMVAFRRLKQ